MTFKDNLKQAIRWYSVHALFLATATPVAMTEAENYLGDKFPLWIKATIAGAIFVSGVIGRCIPQEKTNVDSDSGGV